MLKETVYEIDGVGERCANYGGFGIIPLACTEWDFDKGTCDTFLPKDPPDWMRVHEHMHCLGYDHYGSTYMQDNWNEWKGQHGK